MLENIAQNRIASVSCVNYLESKRERERGRGKIRIKKK